MTSSRGSRAIRVGGAAAASAVTAAAAAAGVITAQGFAARRAVGVRSTVPPYADGRYGGSHGISLRLAIIGDSLAAGLGAEFPHETPGAIVAEHLTGETGRAVVLSTTAVVGARSEHLLEQIERALIIRPNVAIVIIGANDVTHLIPRRRSVKRLRDGVRRLRESGVNVVVGTCPDLGTVRLIGPPARNVMRRHSRLLARAQTVVALQEGACTVSFGDLLGPEFEARPSELFAADHFHPNAQGYAAVGQVLVPAAIEALGLHRATLPALYEPEITQPLGPAADLAVAEPGTILTRTPGRWTRVVRRIRSDPPVISTSPTDGDPEGRTLVS